MSHMQRAPSPLVSGLWGSASGTVAALALTALMFATGCGFTRIRPKATYENVSPPPGNLQLHDAFTAVVSYDDPSTLLARWSPGQGLFVSGNRHVCGQEVAVRRSTGEAAFGHLIVFDTLPGSGPAGRGDYLVKIGDDAIDAVKQGRMSVRYETYDSPYGGEHYAWILFLSDKPLPCAEGSEPIDPAEWTPDGRR